MDGTKIQTTLETLTEQILSLHNTVAELRASVNVLKGILAIQLNPDDPADGAKQIQSLEAQFLNFDPNLPARQRAAEIIEAVKLARKHGGSHES